MIKPRIFISYRRNDSASACALLYERLVKTFGDKQVFRDIDTIGFGEKWREAITMALSGCDILLIVIGKSWLTITDSEGRRRLDNAEDVVRFEIVSAIRRDIKVIPILVDGAEMPEDSDLPYDLKPLLQYNAITISHGHLNYDLNKLAVYLQDELKIYRRPDIVFVMPLFLIVPFLQWISQYVVPDPVLRSTYIVIAYFAVLIAMFAVSQRQTLKQWPLRLVFYILMSFTIVIVFSLGAYTFNYLSNPVYSIAPSFMKFSRPLPYMSVYGTNARILENQLYTRRVPNGPERFIRLRFQLFCEVANTDCNAGWIIANLQGVDNPNTRKELVFEVRGAIGNEIIGVSLKDYFLTESRVFDIGKYIPRGIAAVTTDWQTVRIPLTQFNHVNMEALDVVSFFVDKRYTQTAITDVDLANIHLE